MLTVRLQQAGPIRLDATLTCGAGELLALVGPSGSGKTSVLRAIAGLLDVAEGAVRFGDQPWFDSAARINVPAEHRPVGMVFQHYALFPHLSALKNVALALPKGQPVEAAYALLRDMRLDALAERLPHQLSGGQRQRVALARALARQPSVLLLDEAFSAVDQPTRHLLYDELIRLRERVSLPIVMVTHDLREARLLADRLCILDGGETLQAGAPESVLSRPRNARVAALVGVRDIHEGVFHAARGVAVPPAAPVAAPPAAAPFCATSATASRSDQAEPADPADLAREGSPVSPGRGWLRWGAAGEGLQLQVIDKGRLSDGTPVRWVIPGEQVQIYAESVITHGAAAENTVQCRVERLRRLGEITTLECRTHAPPNALLHLEVPTRQVAQMALQAGASVWLELPAAGIHIMPIRADRVKAAPGHQPEPRRAT